MCNTKTNESDILAALEVCKAWNDEEITDEQYIVLLRLACSKCNAPTITPNEKENLVNSTLETNQDEKSKRFWGKIGDKND